MDKIEFKTKINEHSGKLGFTKVNKNWLKQGKECSIILELQKSDYSNNYYINIRIFINELLNKSITKEELVKKLPGHIFLRTPKKYQESLNLENEMESEKRLKKLDELFNYFLKNLTQEALTIKGLIKLNKQKTIKFLPYIEDKINNL